MSLLCRLIRPLRPTTFGPASTFYRGIAPRRAMPSDFFYSRGSRPSIHNVGISRRSYSSFPFGHNSSLKNTLLFGIIGLNTAIFGYANYVELQAKQGFPKPLIQFWQNMTMNLDETLYGGKWWQPLTCVFTHFNFMHVFANLLSFYYMGELLVRTPGLTPVHFLTLIVGSGLAGSAFALYSRNRMMQGQPDRGRSLGFSGAVMGVGAVAACLYPRTTMAIWGIIPVPLWALMAGYAVFDGALVNNKNSRVSHSGHLGGLAFGLAYYFARLRGLRIPY